MHIAPLSAQSWSDHFLLFLRLMRFLCFQTLINAGASWDIGMPWSLDHWEEERLLASLKCRSEQNPILGLGRSQISGGAAGTDRRAHRGVLQLARMIQWQVKICFLSNLRGWAAIWRQGLDKGKLQSRGKDGWERAVEFHEMLLLLLRGIDALPSPARNPEIWSWSWSPAGACPSALFSPAPGEQQVSWRWGRERGGRHFPETANCHLGCCSLPPPPTPAQLRHRCRCSETFSQGRLQRKSWDEGETETEQEMKGMAAGVPCPRGNNHSIKLTWILNFLRGEWNRKVEWAKQKPLQTGKISTGRLWGPVHPPHHRLKKCAWKKIKASILHTVADADATHVGVHFGKDRKTVRTDFANFC